jgi:hypothetical protein
MAKETKMLFMGSMIAKVFGLSTPGTTTSREGYNTNLGEYFLGAKANQYV